MAFIIQSLGNRVRGKKPVHEIISSIRHELDPEIN